MSSIPATITAVTDSKLPVVIHRDGSILFVNKPILKLFGGQSPADVEGKSIDDFVDQSFIAEVQARRELFKAGEALEPVQGKLLRLDDKPFEAAITSFVVNHEGEPALASIIVDLDREMHHDAEVEDLRDQLRKLMTVVVGREVRMEELKLMIEKLKLLARKNPA